MFTFSESLYFKHRGHRSLTRKHLPKHTHVSLNDKRWNTKRTFNLIEPRSDQAVALLRRRAARETGSGKFQLHGNTEATTSWHSFRLCGRRLLDERRDEWAWKDTADSGFNCLTDRPQYASDPGWCVAVLYSYLFKQMIIFNSIILWSTDRIGMLLPGLQKIKIYPYQQLQEPRIDSFLFIFMKLIIWFDGRIDKSAGGVTAQKKHAGFRAAFPGERCYNPDSELGSQCLASCLLTR